MSLQVWPHNQHAMALYDRAGFEVEGVLRGHYRRRSGELWDAVLMGLPLSARLDERIPAVFCGTEGFLFVRLRRDN
ncbi:GNAT family N-acetyltransferase [Nocardia arthritidis]|uniref:GNAT family N-acetyltransferase n=1 Tax=Nocardia arthritidis TaxID=228602 RepID=UPI0012ED4C74|nr:hypothetical protein [Nocardia arthritidis]